MTILSILASNGIAVPLSSGFPASEIRYILDNSEAMLLLASKKFKAKAKEVLKEGLDKSMKLHTVEKRRQGAETGTYIELEESGSGKGGMMLYTSGTTNRPVRVVLSCIFPEKG